MLSEEWRSWLVDATADLIARCGAEPFVASPILFPTDEHFPDELPPGAVGARTLVRRMMRHAGLGELHVDLQLDAPDPDARSPLVLVEAADDRASFLLHEHRSPDELTGFLCFEVSRAFRESRRLDEAGSPYRDRVTEEPETIDQLAAATSVYLGFGLLATSAAHAYSASGHLDGNWVYTQWRHSFAGALPVDALAWLLAAQVVVRGWDDARRAKLRSALRPNARKAFDAAHRELAPRREQLCQQLGLPDASKWPAERAPNPTPLPPDDADAKLADEESAGLAEEAERDEQERRERVVYRVRERRSLSTTTVVALLLALVAYFGVAAVTRAPLVGAVAALLAVATAYFFALSSVVLTCSDSECRSSIGEVADRCPGCGHRVAGDVASRAEALDLPRYSGRASKPPRARE